MKGIYLTIWSLALSVLPVLQAQQLSQPELVRSFGPNGTHWPSLIPTPFMYDDSVPHRIVVDADWGDIGDAIESVTAAQANEGVLILIRPGTMSGNGNGGGSAAVLKDIGSTEWSKRITVAPLDGYGSVVLTGGVRILRVQRVCFAGFEVVDGIKLEGCKHSAIAWCKVSSWFAVYGNSLVTTDLMEIVEVVQPNHYISNGDSSDYFTNGGDITDWRFDGSYHAPRFFEFPYSGSKPHTDTFQFAGSGGGSYGNMTLRDGAYFSSNNCAIQTGSVDGLKVEHSYVVSGSVSLSRYPHLPGGATEATVNAFNGGGSNFTAKDSIFIGGMALNTSGVWVNVENTKTDRLYSVAVNPVNGSWIVDESLKTDLSTMPPYPTDTYLQTIWADNGGGVIPDPDEESPTVPLNLSVNVLNSSSAMLSWDAATDNQSIAGYRIFLDGMFLRNVATTETTLTGLSPLTEYAFSVVAYDASNNESAQSEVVQFTIPDAPVTPEPDDFLVAHWPMDEVSGVSVTDVIGNRIGNFAGTPQLGGGVVQFDSDIDKIDVAAFDVSGDGITLACWVEVDSFSGLATESRFISKATSTDSAGHYWMLGNYEDGSAVRFRLKVGGTTYTLVTPTGKLTLAQRHHVAATFDGENMRIYVDGVEEALLAVSGEVTGSDTALIGLGNQPTGAGDRALIGSLDDVRIYSYAVPAVDMTQVMNPVIPNLGYVEWLADFGMSDLSATDDSDKDGIGLFLEYAFGLNPNEVSSQPVTLRYEGGVPTVVFDRTRSDLNYVILTSIDLEDWGTDWVNQETGVISSTPDKLFFRVFVSE